MTTRKILGTVRTVTATNVLNAVGKGLSDVASAKSLTNNDLARILNKSDDTVGNYRNSASEMGVTAFAFATEKWGAEFADPLLNELGYRLCPIDAEDGNPHRTATDISHLLASFLEALSTDEDGDGNPLDHTDVLKLAKFIRPLMPKLQAILDRAEALRSA